MWRAVCCFPSPSHTLVRFVFFVIIRTYRSFGGGLKGCLTPPLLFFLPPPFHLCIASLSTTQDVGTHNSP
jgi:hypothetical protein